MGSNANVGYDRMPAQGPELGCRAEVIFDRDPSRTIMGTIVRHDVELPYRTIILLDDGRAVLATECLYSPKPKYGESAGS